MALKDDILLVKPGIFGGVPRIINRFYEILKGKLDALTGIKKKMVDKALATKLENLRYDGTTSHFIYDRLVFNKIRDAFGGNLRLIFSGSAPLSLQVK